MRNLISSIIFGPKCPNQCKESLIKIKAIRPHLDYGDAVYVKNELGLESLRF